MTALRRLREALVRRLSLAAPFRYAYVTCLLWVGAVTAAGFWIEPTVGPTNLAILYLLVVVITALRLGRRPAILAAGVSALTFDFFFVPPHRSFAVSDAWYLITLLGLLSVALIVSTLASRAREREAYSAAAYSLIKELIPAKRFEDIVKIISDHVETVLERQTVVLITEPGGLRVAHCSPDFQFDDRERAAAQRAIASPEVNERRQEAPHARYFPLRTSRQMIGLVGVRSRGGAALMREQERLLDAFAGQSALAMERTDRHPEQPGRASSHPLIRRRESCSYERRGRMPRVWIT